MISLPKYLTLHAHLSHGLIRDHQCLHDGRRPLDFSITPILGHHLNIALGRSLLVFTAFLVLLLLARLLLLLHTFFVLGLLLLFGAFGSLWGFGCALTALRLLSASTEKKQIMVLNRSQDELNLLGLSLFFFVFLGSSRPLLFPLHEPQECQE